MDTLRAYMRKRRCILPMFGSMSYTASERWRKSGVNLALFAMLALWISPALAWACCCHQAAVSLSPQASPQPEAQGHSCCPQPAETAQLSAPHTCDCESAQSNDLVRAEAPDSFSFAPVAVAVSPVDFGFAPHSNSSLEYKHTYQARPRGPDLWTRGGRAPPVFSA